MYVNLTISFSVEYLFFDLLYLLFMMTCHIVVHNEGDP